jgi:hypothetical protein
VVQDIAGRLAAVEAAAETAAGQTQGQTEPQRLPALVVTGKGLVDQPALRMAMPGRMVAAVPVQGRLRLTRRELAETELIFQVGR